jgi:hypothetical protein
MPHRSYEVQETGRKNCPFFAIDSGSRIGALPKPQVVHQLRSDQTSVGWWYGFVDFALGHPIDPHCFPRRSNAAISAARHLNEILPLTRLSVVVLTFVKGMNQRVATVWRRDNREIRFEKTMPQHTQSWKHRSTEHNRAHQWGTLYVFDDVWETSVNKQFPDGVDKTRPFMGVAVPFGKVGVGLARRRSMKRIKQGDEFRIQFENIGLNERKGVMRLRIDVNPNNLKTGFSVANSGAASTAE